MKKHILEKIILVMIVVVLILGAGVAVLFARKGNGEKNTEKVVAKSGVRMFSEFTDNKIFETVPAMYIEGTKIGTAADCGSGNYMIDVNGASKEDYEAYLKTLEAEGFDKFCDNGEEGMEGYVYSAYYTKGDLVVTVSHVVKLEKTYITVSQSKDMALSDRMIYKDEYVQGIKPGAKTTLSMLQLNSNGNCFIIQLKNGHFILEDGGLEDDAPYLLDYLESLTPEGEKPVIEGWFISHAHGDHYEAMRKIYTDPEYADRIYVDGIYFTEPGPDLLNLYSKDSGATATWFVKQGAKVFKGADGECGLYRTQMGQKFYFCDIQIDVAFTLEQVTVDSNYSQDFNDTSTFLMHHIEGQRFLHAGDAGRTETNLAMMYYDRDYFNLDVFAVLHHGINVYDDFTDYCTVKTALYTSFRNGSVYESGTYAREAENAYFKEHVQEYLSHGEGTVVLTFPYTVGTAKILPSSDWRYNGGQPNRKEFQ